MSYKLLTKAVVGAVLLSAVSLALATPPTFTGQCPSASEINIMPANVTVNGKPVKNAYTYFAFTGHNGFKMFATFQFVKGKQAVSRFAGAYLNTSDFTGSEIIPVVCSYRLHNGRPLILGAVDALGAVEQLRPKGANWSNNICKGSSAGDCLWSNKINPMNSHAS